MPGKAVNNETISNNISFNPAINGSDFFTFWSTGKARGTCKQKMNKQNGGLDRKIEVLYGKLDLSTLEENC